MGGCLWFVCFNDIFIDYLEISHHVPPAQSLPSPLSSASENHVTAKKKKGKKVPFVLPKYSLEPGQNSP